MTNTVPKGAYYNGEWQSKCLARTQAVSTNSETRSHPSLSMDLPVEGSLSSGSGIFLGILPSQFTGPRGKGSPMTMQGALHSCALGLSVQGTCKPSRTVPSSVRSSGGDVRFQTFQCTGASTMGVSQISQATMIPMIMECA